MIYSFAGLLVLITAASFAIHFFSRLRSLQSAGITAAPANLAGRYRPMLRLLSDEDFGLVAGNADLLRKMRAERRQLFRSYLACLIRDYARLLEGVRMAMVQSKIDRPDLAKALAKNRALFAMAICKVEFRLALHAAGVGSVDISGLVEALETLRTQVTVFAAPQAALSLS